MGYSEDNYDVLESALRLARALRRSAPRHDHMLPPAIERTLVALNGNDGLSSGELCEVLGVRPSSLSELIDKMERHGLVQRSIDEQDKRIVRISLTETGAETAAELTEKINARKSEVEGCFDEGEAEQFCILADKLSSCLQGGEDDLPPRGGHGPHGPGRRGFGRHGFGGPGMHGQHGGTEHFGGPNEFGGHGMHAERGHWDCQSPEFRHPGHRDCRKSEFRHC